MERCRLIASIVTEILARKDPSRPLRVAIDGRCASGKTMLTDELAATIASTRPDLQVLRPSIDGFHHTRERRYQQGEFSPRGYYEDAYDYAMVIESLLGPLSGDRFPVLCRQVCHDWRTNLPVDAPPVTVGTDSVLLFEGVFLMRQRINSYWDFRILVDVDADTALERALERDADALGSREIIVKKYQLRYEPAWQLYIEEAHPEWKADLIVHNQDLLHPRLSEHKEVN